MATSEYNIESIVILMLQDQAALSGVSVVHHDADADAEATRICVTCEPREAELASYKPADNAKVWRCSVKVSVHVTSTDSSLIDTYSEAVDAAMTGTPPAAAISAAGTAFPNGLQIFNDEPGSRNGDGAETHMREKPYTAIFRT